MLRNEVIKGKERTFYSVRIIVLCMAVAALVSGLVSVPVVLVLSDDAADRSYQADVKSCERSQDSKRELNKRLITQRSDAKNLGNLATTMADVRKSEARAFELLGLAFHIEKQVAPLISVLRDAAKKDHEIAHQQSLVYFKNAVIDDCHNTDVVPKP